MLFKRIVLTMAAVTGLSACDFDSDQEYDVPATGLFLQWQVNLHRDQNQAVTVVGLYNEGQPASLQGGDVFIVRNSAQELHVKESALQSGSYIGLLENIQADETVTLDVEHRPVEAREDRWYPSDALYVDFGPTVFNGLSTSVTFPAAVIIQSPVEGMGDQTVFTTTAESIALQWDADSAGDNMEVRVAISCDNTLAIQNYGRTIALGLDSGSTDLSVADIIYNLDDEIPGWIELSTVIRDILQQELNRLSAGSADEQFFAKRAQVNPITSNCDIELFMFRLHAPVDTDFSHSEVHGSRSDHVSLKYRPDTVVIPKSQ